MFPRALCLFPLTRTNDNEVLHILVQRVFVKTQHVHLKTTSSTSAFYELKPLVASTRSFIHDCFNERVA